MRKARKLLTRFNCTCGQVSVTVLLGLGDVFNTEGGKQLGLWDSLVQDPVG